MVNFWMDRNGREKALICVASTLILIIFLWQFLYKPLVNYSTSQVRAYNQAELDLKIVQKGQSFLTARQVTTGSAVTILREEKLQSTVTKIAKANGLKISRRQPKGDKEITMWFEKAESKAFFAWVEEMTGEYNIKLVRAHLTRNDGGTIRAQATLILWDK